MNSLEDIPAAIPSLIDAAVAAFDADRDTSRRYLLRASALLRVKCGACAHGEGARPSESRGGLLAWQLNRVVDYIETHLAEKMMATNIADLINVSVGQLIRAFKVSVGVPPRHYIASRRVELACTMMSTTREPLSQIAIACGLCDQAHLCKVFRRMLGMSPSAWRREQEMSGVDNMSLGMAAPDRGLQGAGPRQCRDHLHTVFGKPSRNSSAHVSRRNNRATILRLAHALPEARAAAEDLPVRAG